VKWENALRRENLTTRVNFVASVNFRKRIAFVLDLQNLIVEKIYGDTFPGRKDDTARFS
jgi:hypothetical protein